jgi:hypothetical protein
MDTIMRLDLAKDRMARLVSEAERERLVREFKIDRNGTIHTIGFRTRIARLMGNVPPLGTGGPRPAGAEAGGR